MVGSASFFIRYFFAPSVSSVISSAFFISVEISEMFSSVSGIPFSFRALMIASAFSALPAISLTAASSISSVYPGIYTPALASVTLI